MERKGSCTEGKKVSKHIYNYPSLMWFEGGQGALYSFANSDLIQLGFVAPGRVFMCW